MAKYSDLDRVMKEARRNEANWSEDFRRGFNSIESYSESVNSRDNRRLTNDNQKSSFYGNAIAYIQFYAEANYNQQNIRTGNKLDEIKTIGENLSRDLTAIGGAGQVFHNASEEFKTVIMVDAEALENRAYENDIKDYTDNVRNVINNAVMLAQDNKIEVATVDILTQIGLNMDLINGNNNLDVHTKRAVSRSASEIASFYNDNLFDSVKRDGLKDSNKLYEFNKAVTGFMTENLTAVSVLRTTNPQNYQGFEEIANKTNTFIKSDMEMIVRNVATSRWVEWENRKLAMEQAAVQEHEAQVQQEMQKHGFATKEQQALQNIIDANPEQYAEVTFIDNIREVLGIDEQKFPENLRNDAVFIF